MSTSQVSHHDQHRCDEGSCIKADIIESLDHIVNGNGQPGVVQKLAKLDKDLGEFVSYTKGRDDARAEAEKRREQEEQARERRREHWRWALGILATLVIGLLLWLLSILVPPPLKEKGIISHDNQTYSKQMISKE